VPCIDHESIPRLVHAWSSTGLFVPKPTTDADCQRPSTRGLRQTVRGRPLPSPAVRGDCHSLCHSPFASRSWADAAPHAFQVCAAVSGVGHERPWPRVHVRCGVRRTRLDVAEWD